jgi:hypothetical protein
MLEAVIRINRRYFRWVTTSTLVDDDGFYLFLLVVANVEPYCMVSHYLIYYFQSYFVIPGVLLNAVPHVDSSFAARNIVVLLLIQKGFRFRWRRFPLQSVLMEWQPLFEKAWRVFDSV